MKSQVQTWEIRAFFDAIKLGVRPERVRVMTDRDILTIEEAAEFLQLGKRSVYKLAKAGRIPGKKVLNKWRFERESLKRWIREGTL